MSKTKTSEMPASEKAESKDRAQVNAGFTARSTWRFSMDHVRIGLNHCTAERREILIWAFQWCTQRNISIDEFAAATSYGVNTLYKIYTGKHFDPRSGDKYDIPDKLFKAALKWREIQLERAKLGKLDFIITPSVKRVWAGCDLARESQTPVFIYGASHLGKTLALQEYAVTNNHGRSPMIRVPSASGLVGLVKEIAIAVGVSPNANTRDLTQRIIRAVDNTTLLILDEVHQLMFTYRKQTFFSCMEVIRMIYDATECGMVLCTTNVFGAKMETEKRNALEQVFRRGVHRVQLGDKVRVADLKPILADHGLGWPTKKDQINIGGIIEQPYEMLRQLSANEGLKAITERIRYSKKLANSARQDLTFDHFTKAHLIIQNNANTPQDDWS